MKKILISTLTITSMLLLPTLRADEASVDATTEVAPMPETVDEGTPVGQASNEGSSDAKKRMWTNIGLAIGAVAIAVTALILVSQNEGHRHRDDHKSNN